MSLVQCCFYMHTLRSAVRSPLSSLQAAEALTAAEEEKAVVQERCKEGV